MRANLKDLSEGRLGDLDYFYAVNQVFPRFAARNLDHAPLTVWTPHGAIYKRFVAFCLEKKIPAASSKALGVYLRCLPAVHEARRTNNVKHWCSLALRETPIAGALTLEQIEPWDH